jgi:hypothetical protein
MLKFNIPQLYICTLISALFQHLSSKIHVIGRPSLGKKWWCGNSNQFSRNFSANIVSPLIVRVPPKRNISPRSKMARKTYEYISPKSRQNSQTKRNKPKRNKHVRIYTACPCLCCMLKSMQHGHGHAALNGQSACTGTSMDMDTQQRFGHAAWTFILG